MTARIPEFAQAVIHGLDLDRREPPPLPDDWNRALDFADQTQLTLAWRARLAASDYDRVPAAVRSRLDRNLADNTERQRRLEAEFARIADRLATAGVAFLVLKGFTHSPHFVPDARLRVQYDFDLYCPTGAIHRARDVLLQMGYRSQTEADDFPVDHLPAMQRAGNWRWRGNFFDPEMPPAVDLHFRFWDAGTEQLPAPGVADFWARRVERSVAERPVYQLDLIDQLGYAALHAVRHLLRGSLRLHQVYEIAGFLQNRARDVEFWSRWRQLHPAELRRLESIAFRLAGRYFGAPPVAAEALPSGAQVWFERHAWAPIESLFHPNKHELLLHVSLLGSARERRRVAVRRLLPWRVPRPWEAAQGSGAGDWTRYAGLVARRLLHHGKLLAPTLLNLWRWRREHGHTC